MACACEREHQKRKLAVCAAAPMIDHVNAVLQDIPATPKQEPWPEDLPQPPKTDWDALIKEITERGKHVPEIDWADPGEDAGLKVPSLRFCHAEPIIDASFWTMERTRYRSHTHEGRKCLGRLV